MQHLSLRMAVAALALAVCHASAQAQPVKVEGQPLAANIARMLKALEFIGQPFPIEAGLGLERAVKMEDAEEMQKLLDQHVLAEIHINPEGRIEAKRGPATLFFLQQGGYTAFIIKVHNELKTAKGSAPTKSLKLGSPNAQPIVSRGNPGEIKVSDIRERYLEVEMFTSNPMTEKLSGLSVEYMIALIYTSQTTDKEPKKDEKTEKPGDKGPIKLPWGKVRPKLTFDVVEGKKDLGLSGQLPIEFTVKPAIPVHITIEDYDSLPKEERYTAARFTFKDAMGKVYPAKSKRLAPDFFFQDQVYRHSGGIVLLPPGELTMTYGRGPEYRLVSQKIKVPDLGEAKLHVKLQRWINPMNFGFYSGDHHIHAAGCQHYTNPTEGVFAEDMFLHVKGEGMNVGCNLTWGPCFDFQRQFFEPTANKVSEPFTVLKYDIEVSGFGSQALGHVCLLNLRDQTYPGSDGLKTKGWPTWTTPLMRWAKNQGAYTGYAHSASGLGVNAKAAAKRVFDSLDIDKGGKISPKEAEKSFLPDTFKAIDTNNDGMISIEELTYATARVSGNLKDIPAQLPNYAVPEMDGIGAQEICVTTAQGLCDFISAMDTNRVPEWNCWYHLMNCGYPLKVSGETDFPCITGSRVGQGRVYVQLGNNIKKIEFSEWAEALAKGRSYVSDGYAHALEFTVNKQAPGDRVKLREPGKVTVHARVAFAADTPLGTANGGKLPESNKRTVELIVNGEAVATQIVPADDKEHVLTFTVNVERSAWIALRHFPQMHTNPVEVIVDNQPIRVSRRSALWCAATIEQLWRVRGAPRPANSPGIAQEELAEADRVFQWAIERYRRIADECPPGS